MSILLNLLSVTTISFILFHSALAAVPAAIVNGETVTNVYDKYYMVQIRGNGGHICGGALISERFVLTAGHCIQNTQIPSPDVIVDVITDSLYTEGYWGEVHAIEKLIPHPLFKYPATKDLEHDIGVIKLLEDVTFSPTRGPISLPTQDIQNYSPAIVMGWGRLNPNRNDQPSLLQQLRVRVFDRETCQQHLPAKYTHHTFFENDFCTYTINSNHGFGTCQGDSGSPLRSSSGEVIGVVSSGIGPCGQGGVEIYTNVFRYLNFIKQAMMM